MVVVVFNTRCQGTSCVVSQPTSYTFMPLRAYSGLDWFGSSKEENEEENILARVMGLVQGSKQW